MTIKTVHVKICKTKKDFRKINGFNYLPENNKDGNNELSNSGIQEKRSPSKLKENHKKKKGIKINKNDLS